MKDVPYTDVYSINYPITTNVILNDGTVRMRRIKVGTVKETLLDRDFFIFPDCDFTIT
jgi:hypothetical protein